MKNKSVQIKYKDEDFTLNIANIVLLLCAYGFIFQEMYCFATLTICMMFVVLLANMIK